MKFQPYPHYQDSGVEWLGVLPAHWNVQAIKHIVETPITDGPHETPDFISDGVPFVSAEAVSSGQINFEKIRGYISRKDHEKYSRKYRPKLHDIYMVKSGATTGVTAIVETENEFNIWSPLAVIRCANSAIPHFILNVLRSRNFQEAVALNWSFGTQQNIGMGVIQNLRTPLPPIEEQREIAHFLTRETAKIDTLIGKQERLIELAHEKRQAIISHAVTKGLNPDVKMKGSQVEWLGNVPEHWGVYRNKVVFQEVDLRSETEEGELLSVSHITGVTPRSEKNVNMFLAETLEGYKCCNAGDLVINTMWAWMGALGISPCKGLVSPAYNVYRPRQNERIDPAYYDLLSRIPTHAVAIKANSTGVWESRLRLYPQAFLTMSLCVPPMEEQREIVRYLSNEISKIEALITKSQRNIELMREHRTALISAVVTGKIDVRKAA